ncbi:phage tail tube protein [Agromyces sp. SYSU T00194]|uniref:phage tail tube protein n=1 Tax=Agromyces chitinivorans TaxID=3158560 RepID=UPI0033945E56
MTTLFDSAVGLAKEPSFGTYTAPTKFVEFTEAGLKKMPTVVTGSGRRYGERVRRADRRVVTAWDVAGPIATELLTKGMGALFEAVLGTGTSTSVPTTSAFQQLFTPSAGDPVDSYTIQASVPFVGGATQPHSFVGMYATGLTMAIAEGGVPTLQVQWSGKDLDTGQSFVTPSYPADTSLFSFVHGAIVVGGSLTVPTTTEVGSISGGTTADVTDFNLQVDNGMSPGRRYLGGSGLIGNPGFLGELGISGSITVDYTSNALRDAFIAQDDLALMLTFQHPVEIDTGVYPTVQVVVPNIRLDGDIPTDNNGAPISLQLPFTGLGVTGSQPIYFVVRTAETAIF